MCFSQMHDEIASFRSPRRVDGLVVIARSRRNLIPLPRSREALFQLPIFFENHKMAPLLQLSTNGSKQALRDVTRMHAESYIFSLRKALHYPPFLKYNFKYDAFVWQEWIKSAYFEMRREKTSSFLHTF